MSGSLGPYTLLSELGRGGQGTVWLAEDTRLHRKVALKVLNTVGQVPSERLARFQREAEAVSRLDHPQICPVFDAGEVDGVPFMAMRHVEGETLAEAITGRRDADATPSSREDVHRVVALIEEIARALHHAHELGLVHRDIKPGNIMVTPDDKPVVLDFGLAHDELADSQSLTLTGDLLGTPAYMSPEQLVAQRIPLDRRTDIYSLGTVLYECLTLQPPFVAPTRAQLYQRILSGDPSSASTHNRQIPRDLQVVLETAMERDRERRYRTAADFAEDLRRVREFEPIQARPIGRLLRLRRWAQRHPVLSAGVAVGLAGLIAVSALLIRSESARSRAEAIVIANAADRIREQDPGLALALALRAVDLDPSQPAISQLHAVLAMRFPETIVRPGVEPETAWRRWGWSASGWAWMSSHDVICAWDAEWQRIGPARIDPPMDRGVVGDPLGAGIAMGLADRSVRFLDAQLVEIGRLDGEQRPVAKVAGVALPVGEEAGVLIHFEDGGFEVWSFGGSRLQELLPPGSAKASTPTILTHAGDEVVFGLEDGTVCVWHRDGRLEQPLQGTTAVVVASCAAGGRRGAACFADGKAMLWDLDADEQLRELDAPEACTWIEMDNAGSAVLTFHGPSNARLWRGNGDLRRVLHRPRALAMGFHIDRLGIQRLRCFSPAGNRFVTIHGTAACCLWDRDGAPVRVVSGVPGNYPMLYWAPDGRSCLISLGSRMALTNLEGNVRQVFRGGYDNQLAGFGGAGRRFVIGSGNGAMRCWSVDGDSELPQWSASSVAVRALDLTRDGTRVATGSDDGTCRIWDRAGRLVRELGGEDRHSAPVQDVRFSPNGRFLASASQDSTVRVWDVERGDVVSVLRHDHYVLCADFDDTGERVTTASWDDLVRIWSRDGDELMRYRPEPATDQFVSRFSKDRSALLIGSSGSAELFDIRSSTRRKRFLREPSRNILDLQESPDGRRILVANGRGQVRLCNAVDLTQPEREFIGHQQPVRTARFSPDGTLVLTASTDQTARIWDLDGNTTAILRGHTAGVREAVFTPDGKKILTTSIDGTVRTWFVDPADLIEHGRSLLRPLNAAQQAEFDEVVRAVGR